MRILLIFLLLAPFVSQATGVNSSNTEYANKELKFYKLADPVSGEKELIVAFAQLPQVFHFKVGGFVLLREMLSGN